MKNIKYLSPEIHLDLTQHLIKNIKLENIQQFAKVVDVRVEAENLTIVLVFSLNYLSQNKRKTFSLTYRSNAIHYKYEFFDLFSKRTSTFNIHEVLTHVENILNNS